MEPRLYRYNYNDKSINRWRPVNSSLELSIYSVWIWMKDFADRRTRDLFIRVRNKIDSIGIEIDRVFILIFNFLIREASS